MLTSVDTEWVCTDIIGTGSRLQVAPFLYVPVDSCFIVQDKYPLFISCRQDYCNVLTVLRHRGGTLEPSTISPKHRCSSRYRFWTAGTHNTTGCRFVSDYVQVGDIGLSLTWRNYTGLPVRRVSHDFICWSALSALSLLPYLCTSSRTQWLRCSLFCHCLVLVCGTVCSCSFENRTFNSTVLKLCWRRFCFMWRRSRHSVTEIAALCD